MKYNVGDRVRIKSLDWYNENKDDNHEIKFENGIFTTLKSTFLGQIMTIELITLEKQYILMEDKYKTLWTDEMIEGLAEEETKSKPKPKFKVGDRIITDTNMKGKIIEVVEEGWYRVEFEPHNGIPQPNGVVPEENISLMEEENIDCEKCSLTRNSIRCLFIDNCPHNKQKNIIEIPENYILKDECGNVINTTKIVLEKKPDDKLKLESTKKVREYWSEYTRIYIEIYDDDPNECILTHLLTLEGHRQKGYGKQALIQAEEIAKELGCHKAYLKVETNSWMHNWYLRCGYQWYKNADEGYTWLTKSI